MTPYSGAKWGPAAIGAPAGTVTWSFATLGGVLVHFSGIIEGEPFRQAVRQAFDIWDDLADIDFVETPDGEDSDIRLGWSAIDGKGATLAQATWLQSGGVMIRAEIAFDAAEAWSLASQDAWAVDFATIALHEVGHAIGLGHADEPASVMYAFGGASKALSAGDVAAVTVLYGAAATPPSPPSLPAGFRPLDYIASHVDLIGAFGTSAEAGTAHYLAHGFHEGRTVTFNALDYIASWGDLIRHFGTVADAGATHFIVHGHREGRTATFNALDYIASYDDLILAFGAVGERGARHFISDGFREGRAPDLFDGEQYLENYADLRQAFGTDAEAAAMHYIAHGLFEGRTDADDFVF